ncbi:MFS transporter [Actinocorallia herbida]|uniref:MFS transporter n=1 Tax=Actinocorallia herbida TaxID=58109 RepID=UPI001FE4D480|nr:MFS transporter [Actinocorallia herbida]
MNISVSRRRRVVALWGVSLGYFLVLLDLTVLSVAEPDLAASLGTSVAGLQWAAAAYTVTFGALLPAAGALADRYGAHRVFRAGIVLFSAGSLACAAAPSPEVLAVLRAVTGAAAAACVPASLAVIARLYPDGRERARAVATWAAVSGAAVALGPVCGGLLVDAAGWRAVFVVNAPIAVLVLAATAGRAVAVPGSARRIDWPVQFAACAALALLTDALVRAGSDPGAAVWPGLGALVAAALFAVRERASRAPVADRALLASAGARAGLAAGAAVGFALNGLLFVLPLLLRDRGLSAAATGWAFLPLTVPFAVNPPVTGRLVARFGPRPPILAGLSALACGGTVLAISAGTGASYPWLAVGLFSTGYGVSLVLPALATAIVRAAPDGAAGSAGGLLNAVRQIGATVGVAAMGSVTTAFGPGRAIALAALACGGGALWFARQGPAGQVK